MNKKNIYFIQPNSQAGNSISLPYAIGVIAAYAWQFQEVRDRYNLSKLFYRKDPINGVLDKIVDPYLIGFSNYMWNCDYNLALAEKIKKRYPESIIVFGGHQIPDNTEYLKKYDHIDILIHGEGEAVFSSLLLALSNGNGLSEIPNISFRQMGSEIIKTVKKTVPLATSPSPYLEGLFDDILREKDENIQLDAVIETNRGCPNHCTYCCWVAPKVRKIPLEKTFKEIEWISRNKIEYCFCADANFGIFDRDEAIVDAVVGAKRKNGFPLKFEVACIEGKKDFVFEINKKLNEAGLSKGATFPFQSLSNEVLSNVGRSHAIDRNEIVCLLEKYHKAGIPVYSDVILGLPGETYESFSRGLCEILELGQHNSINVHHCEVLPNATMANPEYIEKFGIKTVSSSLCQPHCENTEDLFMTGRSRIIVETNSMSRTDWKESCKFTVCLVGFHNYGLLQCFAIYLHNEKSISYYDFYSALMTWIEEESSICKTAMDKVTRSLDGFLKGNGKFLYQEDMFGKIFWAFEEGMFLNIAYKLDEFYSEIGGFLHRFNIDEEIYSDLMNYQKGIIVIPGKSKSTLSLNHDFYDYFSKALFNIKKPLVKKKNEIAMKVDSVPSDWCEYGIKYVWYGKRETKTLFTSNPKSVEITYGI